MRYLSLLPYSYCNDISYHGSTISILSRLLHFLQVAMVSLYAWNDSVHDVLSTSLVSLLLTVLILENLTTHKIFIRHLTNKLYMAALLPPEDLRPLGYFYYYAQSCDIETVILETNSQIILIGQNSWSHIGI